MNLDSYKNSLSRTITRSLSLRSRMMLGFGVLVAVIVTGVLAIFLFGMPFSSHSGIYELESSQVLTQLGLVSDLKKDRLLMWLQARKSDMTVLAESAFVRNSLEELNAFLRRKHPITETDVVAWEHGDAPVNEDLVRHLQLVKEAYGQYQRITVVTLEGGLVAASTEEGDEGKSASHRTIMREAANAKSGLAVGIDSEDSGGTPHLVISHVVAGARSGDNPDRTVIGWVNGCIDLDSFLKPLLYTGGRLGETGDIVLVDQYRRVLISPRFLLPDGSRAQLLNYIIQGEAARLSADGGDGVIISRDYRGEDVLAAYRHIDVASNERWGLVVKVDMSEVFAPVRHTVLDALVIGIVGLFGALAVAFVISGHISRPIEQLSQFARRVESGDLETRAHATGSREVASLASAFNHMIQRVQEWHVQLEEEVAERTVELRREISERKLAEQALRESEVRFRSAFTHSRIGMALLAVDGRFFTANTALCRLLGYSEHELRAMDFRDITDPKDAKESSQRFEALTSGKIDGYHFEQRCIHKDGSTIWANQAVSSVRYAGQLPVYAVLQLNDITERKLAEEQLRQSEKRFRRLVETANEGVWVVDTEFRTTFVNSRLADMLGYSPGEMLGQKVSVFKFEEDLDDLCEPQRLAKGNDQVVFECRYKRKDGGEVWAFVSRTPLFNDKGTVEGSFAMVTDITELRKSEEARKAMEQRYQAVVDNARIGISVLNPKMEIVAINKELKRCFPDARPMCGQRCYEHYSDPPRDGACSYCPCLITFQDGEVHEAVTETRVGGETRYFHILSSPIKDSSGRVEYVIELTTDITDEKKAEEERQILEEQLRHAQKMESIGTLAGGIAHDFNNLLTIALGYTDLLLLNRDDGSTEYSELQSVRQAIIRGAELVKQILTFSRKVATNPRSLDINEEVRNVEKFLARTIPKMIDIEVDLEDDIENIYADPGQIQQVLINLVSNAKDAMPDGGRVAIETRTVTLNQEHVKIRVGLEPGPYVQLTVSDTGQGMDEQTRARIFEPFFTTKELGEGTGLGLATVYGIVQGHGGQIYCDSQAGAGTTFTIHLPIAPFEDQPGTTESSLFPAFGTETILFVDDEKPIRHLGRRILERAGYSVLSASDGQEALSLFKEHRSRISLVILDFIMPGMSGKECLEELLTIDPAAKVLISSGFSVNQQTRETLLDRASGWLTKPFQIKEMLCKVREVLDEPSVSSV